MAFILVYHHLFAQSTSGSISGKVLFKGQLVYNAVISILDEGTQTLFKTSSNKLGTYRFDQLKPASNYSLQVTYPLADTLRIQFIQIIVGEDLLLNIPLQPKQHELTAIQVNSSSQSNKAYSSIDLLKNASVNGNELSRLLMHQPAALIKNDQSGAASFSGQNYRFNSYYVDGILQNDQFGLSPTGTILGESGNISAAPESFEQMQLILSPFDASFGNFTGAAINMVTKSGKNKPIQEAYTTARTNQLDYKHLGLSFGGPIIYNKLFYYFNTDQLNEYTVRNYSISNYQGETKQINQLNRFRQTMQEKYGYDPGTLDQVLHHTTNKWAIRFDGVLNSTHQFALNFKITNSLRNSNNASSDYMLIFSNNGKIQQQKNISSSFEWKYKLNSFTQNRLLVSYHQHGSTTQPKLQAFPLIRILDGEGMITLGSSEETYLNSLSQSSITINNRWNLMSGNHFFDLGMETEYVRIKNDFLLNGNGHYFYYSLSNFLQNRNPAEFNINQPATGLNLDAFTTNLNILKWASFINYKNNFNSNTQLLLGLRWNGERFLNKPQMDSFTQNIALPIIAPIHDLQGASSGQLPILQSIPSPRIQLKLFIPKWKTNLKIGMGIFTGRIPYAWLSGIVSNNGNKINHYLSKQNQLNNYPFNPNNTLVSFLPPPNYTITNGTVYFIADKLKLTNLWRAVISIDKMLNPKTVFLAQFMYYKNLTEQGFSNINLNHPSSKLDGADDRLIHGPSDKLKVPINQDGSNPYEEIILIKNAKDQLGYGYECAIQLKNQQTNSSSLIHYSFGKSFSLFDGNYSIPVNHWKLIEHVKGRNQLALSVSDFSQGHRIYAEYQIQVKKKNKKRWNYSIHYNGQSGNAFSYVYGKGNLAGDDPTTTGYDLIYIPTESEINQMYFEPIFKKEIYYTSDQQKEALNAYINHNKYLQKRRGLYAERNGTRAPFTHRLDLKANWYIPVKIHNQKIHFNLSLEILNLANLINAKWGEQLQVQGGRVKLISFQGFQNNQTLIPIYSFDPSLLEKTIFEPNTATNPAKSSNWMFQLGCRLSFY